MASGAPGTERDWRARARAFTAEHVAPEAERIDRTDRVSPELVRRLADQRFFGLGLPAEWDGAGGDVRSTVAVLEELSRGSAAIGVLLSVHLAVCAQPILRWGTDRQREEHLRPLARGERIGAFGLTEPGVGSDTARLATRYERVPSGFRLRGTKMFTSNAASAGEILVFATRDPALGSKGISAFMVPPGTSGFSVAQRLDKLGLRGSETTELVLDGVELPAESLLGREGEGLHVALDALTAGRVGIASCALGVARSAFEQMRESIRTADAEWKRTELARAYAHLASAESLVATAAERMDAGAPYVEAASVAKLVASRAAVAIASKGLEVAGDAGVGASSRAGRLWRDARVFPIVEGTTEIQELILGRRLLGDPAGTNL